MNYSEAKSQDFLMEFPNTQYMSADVNMGIA